MTTLQIQIDNDTKTIADSLFGGYGLNIESAVKMFISVAVKQKRIPFAVENLADIEKKEHERIRQKRLSAKGSLKGQVWMADDFDAPLEEMKEYM